MNNTFPSSFHFQVILLNHLYFLSMCQNFKGLSTSGGWHAYAMGKIGEIGTNLTLINF